MLPLDVLLILFAAGVWVYCLIDAIMTPRAEMRSLGPLAWAIAITPLPVIGAIAWLLVRRPPPQRAGADDAAPAGRGPAEGAAGGAAPSSVGPLYRAGPGRPAGRPA